jgi:hypothetical protein
VEGSDVTVGVIFTAWGVGFVALLNQHRRSDAWRRLMAEHRWWLDSRLDRRARRMGKEAWLAYCSERERKVLTWFGLPFAVIWTCVAFSVLVRGLIS